MSRVTQARDSMFSNFPFSFFYRNLAEAYVYRGRTRKLLPDIGPNALKIPFWNLLVQHFKIFPRDTNSVGAMCHF